MWDNDSREMGINSIPAIGLLIATVIVGIGGMVGQLLLLRELLVAFYGNELTIGVIVGNWLVTEALGAYLAGWLKQNRVSTVYLYLIFLLGFALLLPVAIFLAPNIVYLLFDILPGETVGVFPIVISSLVLLGPVSLAHGASFPLTCRLFEEHLPRRAPVGRIYVYETLGTLLGGALFTLLLAERFLPLELAVSLSVLHVLAGLFIVYLFNSVSLSFYRKVFLHGAAATALVCFVTLLLNAQDLHYQALQYRWPEQDIMHYQNSPYGNIVVTHRKGEYTFFYDGRPAMTVPEPDTALISDFAHLTAAAHPRPERILLLGSGPGGLLNEFLKHPLKEAYYVELDPYLPRVVEQFPTSLTEKELADPRVEVEKVDGRRFLRAIDSEFDLVVMGFLSPDSLQSNRLFSQEFFSLVKERLTEEGILAFTIPGSEAYLSFEMAMLNDSLYKTLLEVFNYVEVIPGEENIFLASETPVNISPGALKNNLKERELLKGMFSEEYLQYRLEPARIDWVKSEMERVDARLNYDFDPAALLYALTYWGSAYSPELLSVLQGLEDLDPYHYLLALLGVTFFIFMLLRRLSAKENIALPFAIGSTGVAAMAFDLLLIFILQTLYGFAYQAIGLLLAIFMGGAFLGGSWSMKKNDRPGKFKLMCYLETVLVALLGAFIGLALLLQQLVGQLPDLLVLFAIGGFSLFAGFAVGAEFPVAAGLLSRGTGNSPTEDAAAKTAGRLYSADLLGGWVGGIVVAIFLFPALGMASSLLILAFLKGCSLVLIIYLKRINGSE